MQFPTWPPITPYLFYTIALHPFNTFNFVWQNKFICVRAMIIYIWISRPFELQKILPFRPFVVLERENVICLIRDQFPYFQLFTHWSLLLMAYTLELYTGCRDYSNFTIQTLAVIYPVSFPSRHFGIKGAREVQFTSKSTSGFSINCVLLAIDLISSHSSIFKKIIKITRSHFQHQYSLWLKNI